MSYGNTSSQGTVQGLHSCLLRPVIHTGSDVRVSSSSILNPKAFPRQSAAATWWKWNKVFSYKWGRSDHINNLELRSIVHSMEWRVQQLKECHLRVFHLTDSYVAMSIISKGRSSSKMLQPLLSRIAALLLVHDLYLTVVHVESSEHPTDEASRQ